MPDIDELKKEGKKYMRWAQGCWSWVEMTMLLRCRRLFWSSTSHDREGPFRITRG